MWVIDAKNYSGDVEVVSGPDPVVRIAGRDRTTKLVRGVRWQADHVRQALDPTYREVPVRSALCFIGTGRRLGTGVTVDGVLAISDRRIAGPLGQAGPWDDRWRNAIQQHLARRFPPAAGTAVKSG